MPNDQSQTKSAAAVASSDLLACPFCGGEAVMEETDLMGNVRKSVGCKVDGCQGYQSTTTFATHREASEAWNKRHILETLRRRRIWTDRKQGLEKALAVMTDEWIESGQCCHQTTMDLRDALKAALAG